MTRTEHLSILAIAGGLALGLLGTMVLLEIVGAWMARGHSVVGGVARLVLFAAVGFAVIMFSTLGREQQAAPLPAYGGPGAELRHMDTTTQRCFRGRWQDSAIFARAAP